jgi:hypothetical protein
MKFSKWLDERWTANQLSSSRSIGENEREREKERERERDRNIFLSREANGILKK